MNHISASAPDPSINLGAMPMGGPAGPLRVALVGATGLVGRTMLEVLAEAMAACRLPRDLEVLPVASERSTGGQVRFNGQALTVLSFEEALSRRPQVALLSAGGGVSLMVAPRLRDEGCWVIDNSSAYRHAPDSPLLVPEVNAGALETLCPPDGSGAGIIANPNCSTIQLVMALAPLAGRYGLARVVVSTYQAVTGSGQRGVGQLMAERNGQTSPLPYYPHPIDLNVLPHIDTFESGGDYEGYTREERKIIEETRRILGLPHLPVTATAVRVPVMGGHSISATVDLSAAFELGDVRALLGAMPGIVLVDDPSQNEYPTPRQAQHRDEVLIGRLRRDASGPNTLSMWIVADNLRKGAATNAVQILERLIATGRVALPTS